MNGNGSIGKFKEVPAKGALLPRIGGLVGIPGKGRISLHGLRGYCVYEQDDGDYPAYDEDAVKPRKNLKLFGGAALLVFAVIGAAFAQHRCPGCCFRHAHGLIHSSKPHFEIGMPVSAGVDPRAIG